MKAVAELNSAASKIVPQARIYAADPNDQNKFRDLVNATKQLQEQLQGLLGALGKEAAESNLRDAARRCAASLAKYFHQCIFFRLGHTNTLSHYHTITPTNNHELRGSEFIQILICLIVQTGDE